MNDRVYRRPGRHLVLAEAPRLLTEVASLMSAAPFLNLAPRGDGHAVLVMPGLGASDRSTVVLRGFLATLGYAVRPWNLGTNLGPRMPDLPGALARRLDEVFAESGARKVSLVGWSLGGVYGRLLGHLHPDRVRQVITLGSPFGGHLRSTSVHAIVRYLADGPVERLPIYELRLLAGEPLPDVPSTAIFSRTDGIVPWQMATQPVTPTAENIEVYAGHLGLGFNPAVLYAVADRLAHREGEWRPFARRGWKRFVYGPARLEAEPGEGLEADARLGSA